MSTGAHNLDSLSDDELIALRRAFRGLCDVVPTDALRALCACINEVDERLAKRGRLDMRTGVIT